MIDRPLLVLIGYAILVLVGPTGAQAIDTAKVPDTSLTEPLWEAAVRYDYDRVSNERADWQQWTAILQRDVPRGTIAATLIRQQRFGVVDEGVAVSLWQDLWPEAYGHLRVGLSPDARIRPRLGLRTEIFQAVGAWELSGHYEWRRYVGDDLHTFGPGLALYVGAWYLRARTSFSPRGSTLAVSQRVGARRYYYWTPSTSYVDLEAGLGRSVELVGPGDDLLVSRTSFVSLRVRHYLTDQLGLRATVRYTDDGPFTRTGGAVGVFAEW